ncbi:MAG: hypothetical protein II341_07480, partial [Oscillospiraceae bacterium]|nr:hypothetical protein [Oscillospiraceae bacterium]
VMPLQLVEKVLFLRVRHPVTAPAPTPPPKGEGLYCEGTAYPQPAKGLRPLNLTRFFDKLKRRNAAKFNGTSSLFVYEICQVFIIAKKSGNVNPWWFGGIWKTAALFFGISPIFGENSGCRTAVGRDLLNIF